MSVHKIKTIYPLYEKLIRISNIFHFDIKATQSLGRYKEYFVCGPESWEITSTPQRNALGNGRLNNNMNGQLMFELW